MSSPARTRGWLGTAFAVVTLAGCAVAPPAPPPPVRVQVSPLAVAEGHVHRAIYILQYRTANDFNGHKAKALRLLRAADRQLDQAQRYAAGQ